jgi:hypothetical protein
MSLELLVPLCALWAVITASVFALTLYDDVLHNGRISGEYVLWGVLWSLVWPLGFIYFVVSSPLLLIVAAGKKFSEITIWEPGHE